MNHPITHNLKPRRFLRNVLVTGEISISLKTLSAGVAREREVGEAVIIKPEGSDAKSESWGLEDLFERPQISRQTRMPNLMERKSNPAGRKRRGPADQRKQQVRQLAINLSLQELP
jgi:hypothetical protein